MVACLYGECEEVTCGEVVWIYDYYRYKVVEMGGVDGGSRYSMEHSIIIPCYIVIIRWNGKGESGVVRTNTILPTGPLYPHTTRNNTTKQTKRNRRKEY